jgi:serine/threonine protein kinase
MSRSSPSSDFGESEAPSGPSLMDAWSAGLSQLGGYQLIRPVGSGGMGAVFEALEQQTGRRVALKTLHRTDPGGLIALKSEFRRMTDVVHRNLALLHELVQDGELLYFAMEFVEGLDFYRYVTGTSVPNAPTLLAGDELAADSRPEPAIHRFRERRLRNSLIQLASGVLALHQEGLLHLDLKPANVLVESGGRVVILDFGLVRPQSARTESQLFCGTPAYMAPEQAEGRAGPPADAYAIGVMLFEALTGDLPFDVRGHAGILGKLRNEAPAATSRRADVPRDLDELCSELLAREPGRRPGIDTIVKRLLPSSSVRLTPLGGTPVTSTVGPRSELIGREDELELLLDGLERCRHGEAAQVYIDGPSGVGKTALMQRFVERAGRERGTLVLEARCYERESIPYKAVDALIDSLAPHLTTRLHAACARCSPSSAASGRSCSPSTICSGAISTARACSSRCSRRRTRRRCSSSARTGARSAPRALSCRSSCGAARGRTSRSSRSLRCRSRRRRRWRSGCSSATTKRRGGSRARSRASPAAIRCSSTR